MTNESPLSRGLNDKLHLAMSALIIGEPNDAFNRNSSPLDYAAGGLVSRVSVAMTYLGLLPSSFLDALPPELRKRLDGIKMSGELLQNLVTVGDVGSAGRAHELASLLLGFYRAVHRFDAASAGP